MFCRQLISFYWSQKIRFILLHVNFIAGQQVQYVNKYLLPTQTGTNSSIVHVYNPRRWIVNNCQTASVFHKTLMLTMDTNASNDKNKI